MAASPAQTGSPLPQRLGGHQTSSFGSDALPPRECQDGPYELDFARCQEDLEAIQRLRFDVFNLELREGLDGSTNTGLDQDEFDETCHHLYVRDRATHRIVGTYRMQTRQQANRGNGFYAATEFDLSDLPEEVLDASLEIGRACIHEDHRSLRVLYLLWKGLGRYASFHNKRYLFGCCSLNSQDHVEAWAVFETLKREGKMHPYWKVGPLPSHACSRGHTEPSSGRLPRLMRTYLSLGASICSEPAIDRQFKTIDFLTMFDFETLDDSDLAFYRFR